MCMYVYICILYMFAAHINLCFMFIYYVYKYMDIYRSEYYLTQVYLLSTMHPPSTASCLRALPAAIAVPGHVYHWQPNSHYCRHT